ncbi:MAG TPA: hypothetical protein VEQ61_08345 [Thermoleophilaceae bacterium]|nr:hypothetical protein [Thermoleophilaceae bacterium]
MRVLVAAGRGMAAGLAGTVALSLSETLEMKVTGREASNVPGQVGAGLLGIAPKSDTEMERQSLAVHWAHGVLGGSVRGLIGTLATDVAYDRLEAQA